MFSTLLSILKDNWEWRSQIGHLALFDIKKRARGAALGWFWLIFKPVIFVLVFWFALEIGLRAGRDTSGTYPYFVWLVSGLIPWFFMSDMITTGSDVLHRYPYLVNKVKFPLSGISTIFTLGTLIMNMIMFAILMVIYTLYGMPWDIYLIQIPILILLMAVFWNMVSILNSQLSGMSRDFGQLLKSMSSPIFWLSGILFPMDMLAESGFGWAADIMLFNPVTFFVTAFRDATCDRVWFWEDPVFFGCFCIVFVIVFVSMLLVYRHFHEEISDAL